MITWLAWILPAGLLLVLSLSASAAETPWQRCERATNVEAAIEACSSVIQTDNDRHRPRWRISVEQAGI
jgi:hypothetical protein